MTLAADKPSGARKKILYYGSCWPTNIGNAFVNLGAINALSAALGESGVVYHFGGIGTYLFGLHGRPQNNLFINDLASFDFVVLAGMTQCDENFRVTEFFLTRLAESGTKIVLAGGGANFYNPDEVKVVRDWMKKVPIYGFISRDTYSYENYGDLAEFSFDGIDSAFFISDGFRPIPLDRDFVVFNFDKMPEPTDAIMAEQGLNTGNTVFYDTSHKGVDSGRRGLFGSRGGKQEEGLQLLRTLDGKLIIRSHHAVWPEATTEAQFSVPSTLLSDLPSDYLNLYSQAHAVYSDRVHACIATMTFGNAAMLFGKQEPRLRMFERVEAGKVTERPVKLDMANLQEEKDRQVEFLRGLLTDAR